jgi:hypothetical protein
MIGAYQLTRTGSAKRARGPAVGKGGFEPPRLAARDPKSRSSANSDTPPHLHYTPVDKQQANVGRGLGAPKFRTVTMPSGGHHEA